MQTVNHFITRTGVGRSDSSCRATYHPFPTPIDLLLEGAVFLYEFKVRHKSFCRSLSSEAGLYLLRLLAINMAGFLLGNTPRNASSGCADIDWLVRPDLLTLRLSRYRQLNPSPTVTESNLPPLNTNHSLRLSSAPVSFLVTAFHLSPASCLPPGKC